MEKHVLIFSLFGIIVVTALKCRRCNLQTQVDRCRRGFGVCVAQEKEECMTLRIFQGQSLQLTYMVCQKFCRNLTFEFNNRIYVHECCKENFCNF